MYDKEDLKMKLKAYSESEDADLMGFVSILEKSLKERFKEDSIYTIPPYMEGSLQDIVAKNTIMTMGIQEVIETKYNIEKMCDDYEEYYNKLINIIKSTNDRHEKIIDEIKEERKPRTYSRVSKIISRVSESNTMYSATYHKWKWFNTITEEVNKILNDKTLSKYEFDVEFISTDTMSVAEDNKFKVITVMYFKLTEYIPDIEIIAYKPKDVASGDMRGSSIISALASQSPEILSFLCMCEYFRIGKDVRAAKLSSFKNFNIVKFIGDISDNTQDRNYLILIAKYENRVVGELMAFLDDWGVEEPTIKSLYVETQYRKKGVAKALVSKLIEETKEYLKDNHIWERKYPYISTLVLDYNKPAIILLEKLGFIPFQRKGCIYLKKDIKIKEEK